MTVKCLLEKMCRKNLQPPYAPQAAEYNNPHFRLPPPTLHEHHHDPENDFGPTLLICCRSLFGMGFGVP